VTPTAHPPTEACNAGSEPSEDPKMVGVEEHAWTAALRDALVKDGTDDTVRMIADGWPEARRAPH